MIKFNRRLSEFNMYKSIFGDLLINECLYFIFWLITIYILAFITCLYARINFNATRTEIAYIFGYATCGIIFIRGLICICRLASAYSVYKHVRELENNLSYREIWKKDVLSWSGVTLWSLIILKIYAVLSDNEYADIVKKYIDTDCDVTGMDVITLLEFKEDLSISNEQFCKQKTNFVRNKQHFPKDGLNELLNLNVLTKAEYEHKYKIVRKEFMIAYGVGLLSFIGFAVLCLVFTHFYYVLR